MMIRSRILIFVFVFSLLSPVAFGQDRFRTKSLVSFPVSVWSAEHGFVKDLTESDFEVFEDKRSQKIIAIEPENVPLTVGILFDLSASSRYLMNRIPSVDGLIEFVRKGNPDNEYFLVGFAKDQQLLVDTTKDKSKIEGALRALATTEARGIQLYMTH